MNLFTPAFHNYKHWCEQRRKELTELVCERTEHEVVHGIFEGMYILPKWHWGDGDHVNKLLGLYENELYSAAQKEIDKNPKQVINLGCAEGYWGVGLCMKTVVPTVMIDIVQAALDIAQENARLNGVENLCTFTTDGSVVNLRRLLQDEPNTFMFIDCEGYEAEFLKLEAVPELKTVSMIVEIHDDEYRPGLTQTLVDRFSASHDVEIISQGAKNPYIYPIHDLGDHDKMLLCIEGRPRTMSWLYAVPK
jgi:hypothetical protein